MLNFKQLYSNESFKKLTSTEKEVYRILYDQYTLSLHSVNKGNISFKDEEGVFCYFGQKALAELIGVTDRTIRRIFKRLKELSFINVVERGCRRHAKIYVNAITKAKAKSPVAIESAELKEAFETTFGESANNSEAKTLNEMAKSNKIECLVEAVKRSKDVQNKRARIKYITKVLVSVLEEADKPKPTKFNKIKKVIREEMVPEWLNKNQSSRSVEEYTSEDLAKIERMKVLQQQILARSFTGGNC